MGIGGQKKVQSAKGEIVDFDLLLIKSQLASAPQNLEVARRQEFIDNKEQGKNVRKKVAPAPVPAQTDIVENVGVNDFENPNGDLPSNIEKKSVEPEPVLITRTPKK